MKNGKRQCQKWQVNLIITRTALNAEFWLNLIKTEKNFT